MKHITGQPCWRAHRGKYPPYQSSSVCLLFGCLRLLPSGIISSSVIAQTVAIETAKMKEERRQERKNEIREVERGRRNGPTWRYHPSELLSAAWLFFVFLFFFLQFRLFVLQPSCLGSKGQLCPLYLQEKKHVLGNKRMNICSR